MRHDADGPDLAGLCGERTRLGEQLALTDARQLLLRVAQTRHQGRHPVGELLGPSPDELGELPDERVLLGLEAVRTVADERLDTPHARPDGGLPEQRDAADLAGLLDVRPGAQLA